MVAESPLVPLEDIQVQSSSLQGSKGFGNPYTFGTNYILEVMKYTNIAMEYQEHVVAIQGELQAVETKIQGCLATISEFFSTLQSNAASGGAYTYGG
ncbi:MAG: hypothetical protein FJZ63_06360, partial [Chlamydiae bacterium]|nr:hypothetical protein [Chlamydiota bacterium]